MDVCPTDIILAPAERIWRLLTDPRELAQWSGTKLVEAPARAVSAGDHLVFRAGMLHITFDVVDMQTPRQLTLDIALPLGVKNREQIQITPVHGELLSSGAFRGVRDLVRMGPCVTWRSCSSIC